MMLAPYRIRVGPEMLVTAGLGGESKVSRGRHLEQRKCWALGLSDEGAGRHQDSESSGLDGTVVLAVVTQMALPVLATRQRGRLRHAGSEVMDDLGVGREIDVQARGREPHAQVHVFLVQKEAFVEEAHRFERPKTREKTRSRDPVRPVPQG